MATLGSLVAELSANTASFHKDMGKAVSALNSSAASMNKTVAGIEKSFHNLNSTIAGVLTIAGARMFVGAVNSSLEFADAIGETARQTGLSNKALQELQYVQSQSGGSTESFTKGMVRFTEVIGDAANGSSQAVDALARVGISVDDLKSKSMEQLYISASDALSKYSDAGTRASIVQDLFGKAAKESANAFAVSRNEIEEMRAAAQAAGQVLSDETIGNAKKAKDEMEAFSRVINIHLTEALVQVAPLLVKGAQLLSEIAEMAGWAARRMGLLADVTAEQKYQALLEKRLDTSERLAHLSKTFFGWIDAPTQVLIEKAKQELAEIDAQIVAINQKAQAAKGTQKPDAPAITGAIKSVDPVSGDTFRKLLADLQKETDRVGMDMTASERTRAEERLNIARNEWFTKANFTKLSTDQQRQFLTEFQDWNTAATAMEEQRLAQAEQARTAKLYNEYTAMQEGFNQKLALETWYNEQRFLIEEFFNEGFITSIVERDAMVENLELQHRARMGDIQAQAILQGQKFQQLSDAQKLQSVLQTGTQMTASVANSSKEMFAVNKALALANAAVSLPDAVIKSFQNAGGYPWGIIPAGLMLATGLAQIQSIRSATFGGSTSPAGIHGGKATPTIDVGGGALAAPPVISSASAPPATAAPIQVTVVLDGQPILETVQRASNDGRLTIYAHAVR